MRGYNPDMRQNSTHMGTIFLDGCGAISRCHVTLERLVKAVGSSRSVFSVDYGENIMDFPPKAVTASPRLTRHPIRVRTLRHPSQVTPASYGVEQDRSFRHAICSSILCLETPHPASRTTWRLPCRYNCRGERSSSWAFAKPGYIIRLS